MPKLKIVVNGIKRTSKSSPSDTRLPITPHILRKIHTVWWPERHEFNTIMLWAASTLCFFGFFRMGELTVPSDTTFNKAVHLTPSDIAVDSTQSPSMLQVRLKKSKTDQEGKGMLIYVGKTNNILCPVSAMLAYLSIRGTKEGPLFHFKDGRALTKERFIPIIRGALTAAGIDATKYSGHSFRIGAATTAAECGIEESIIKAMGRWKSNAYQSYIRIPKDHLAKISSTIGSHS